VDKEHDRASLKSHGGDACAQAHPADANLAVNARDAMRPAVKIIVAAREGVLRPQEQNGLKARCYA
jgi:hypothetical protein